jgi:hypothetical protein
MNPMLFPFSWMTDFMYSSLTDLKMIPNDKKRKKEEMVMIITTLPYMEERNLT